MQERKKIINANTIYSVTPGVTLQVEPGQVVVHDDQYAQQQQQPTTYFEVICETEEEHSDYERTNSPTTMVEITDIDNMGTVTTMATDEYAEEVAAKRNNCMVFIKAAVHNLFFTDDINTLTAMEESCKRLFETSGGSKSLALSVESDAPHSPVINEVQVIPKGEHVTFRTS